MRSHAVTNAPHVVDVRFPDEVVREFRKGTLEYFDGLCLDRMKHSPRENSKYGNAQVTKMVMTKIVVLRAVNMVAEWDGLIIRYFGVQP